jgi:hypothetical protein
MSSSKIENMGGCPTNTLTNVGCIYMSSSIGEKLKIWVDGALLNTITDTGCI